MTIYQKKIAPPLVALNDEEEMALLVELLAYEDRWVVGFIARLTDTIRDMKR
jgi:hypothetical protein